MSRRAALTEAGPHLPDGMVTEAGCLLPNPARIVPARRLELSQPSTQGVEELGAAVTTIAKLAGCTSRAARALSVALLALLLAALPAAPAFAAEPTSGYGQSPPAPAAPEPTSGYGQPPPPPPAETHSEAEGTHEVHKSQEREGAREVVKPMEPETTSAAGEVQKARYSESGGEEPVSDRTDPIKTLPFTGFDVRWELGFGLALIGAGLSIVAAQRRRRHRRLR
jgi:hypothetical protein